MKSVLCEGAFIKLKELLEKELGTQRLIMETLGMVESIQSAGLVIED